MSQPPSNHPSRRDLLAGGLRFAALGALASAGTAAIIKRQILVKDGKCISDGICRGCEVLDACPLPQALSAKKVLGPQNNG